MRLPTIGLLLGAVAGLVAATQPISDPDVFWHLATGRETLAHGLVRADVFSWTVRGATVSTDQWLGQVLMYGAYVLADWRGVAVLRVLCVVALVGFVAVNASLARPVRPLAIVLASLPAMLLTRSVWVDRPELLGVVFFAALLVLLRIGRDGHDGALAAAVPLCVLWANVHGSFALGVVLLLLVCAEGTLRDRARRRAYLACAVATVIGSFVTPAGFGTWTAPGFHLFSPPRDIQEWGVVDVRTPLGAAYVVTLGLVIAAAFLGPRLDARELVVLLPVALLSLTALRQAPLLAIVAAPLFADRAEAVLARVLPPADGPASSRAAGLAMTMLVPAFLLLVALLAAPAQPDQRAYPVAAIASRSIPTGDGILARYEWGGWLIWQGVPVFVDGRLTPYAGAVLDDYRRIIAAAPGWRDAITARGVRTLLVVPTDPVATRAIELGWQVRARSNDFVVITVR